jgi:hypothetical protein
MLLWGLLSSALAHAEERKALVIGIANYNHATNLNSPVLDAIYVTKEFKRFGFKVTEVYDAKQASLKAAISQFMGNVSTGDEVFIYYSGHGVQVDGKNYLLPTDFNVEGREQVKDAAIDAGELIDELAMRQVAISVLILDACRNNPFSRYKSLKTGLALDAGLAPIIRESLGGTLIAFATAPNKTARDGNRGEHSIFTRALLRHMGEPGLEIEQVFKKIRLEVFKETAGEQVPWTSSGINNYFIVPLAPSATAIQVLPHAGSQDAQQEFFSAVSRIASSIVPPFPGSKKAALGREPQALDSGESDETLAFYKGISPVDGFTVNFPAPLGEDPQGLRVLRQKAQTSYGEVQMAMWKSEIMKSNGYPVGFSVASFEYPEGTFSEERPEVVGELEQQFKQVVKLMSGIVENEHPIRLDAYTGKEFTVAVNRGGGDLRIRLRAYVAGQRLYVLFAVHSPKVVSPREVDRFFSSFKLVDAPASGEPEAR